MKKIEDIINKVHQADCLDFMKQIPDKCVDLVVTSPPYDNLRNYEGYDFDFENIAKELFRIIKDGGVVVWVVGDAVENKSESGSSFKQALYFKEMGFNLHDTMIYEKNGSPFPDKKRYFQVFEYMFILSKGVPKTINLIKDRKNKWLGSWGNRSSRNKKGELKKASRIKCEEYGIRFNIWRFNNGYGYSTKEKYAHQHPAIFPEKLAQDHIKSWSNQGDLILDPMNGSGTTTKAAYLLNRKYIGIDISKKYCEIARERLRQQVLL